MKTKIKIVWATSIWVVILIGYVIQQSGVLS
jgi:hypothetical protein